MKYQKVSQRMVTIERKDHHCFNQEVMRRKKKTALKRILTAYKISIFLMYVGYIDCYDGFFSSF